MIIKDITGNEIFSSNKYYSLKDIIKVGISQRISFQRADLRDADLRRADLQRAKFFHAKIDGGVIINKPPVQIPSMRWDILIFDSHISIGCEFHSIAEWKNFNAKEISKMHRGALEFLEENKEKILKICGENGRY